MKRLLMLLIFISVKNGLSAQVTDSTHTDSTRTDNLNNTMNNASRTDTSSTNMMNVRDSANNSSPNSMNNMNNNSMNNATDSAGTMNNMNNSNSTNNTNNSTGNSNMNSMSNMNSNGMSSMSGRNTYAALPVKENYISDDILSKIKSKYGNGTIIYDITAIRRPCRGLPSMMQQNGSMRTDSSIEIHLTIAVTRRWQETWCKILRWQ